MVFSDFWPRLRANVSSRPNMIGPLPDHRPIRSKTALPSPSSDYRAAATGKRKLR
jgi:hypothetical protein